MQRIQCYRVSPYQPQSRAFILHNHTISVIASIGTSLKFSLELTNPRIDQGQAGAQSIEDGAAIGILLEGLRADSPNLAQDIDQRLHAFEFVRRKRASLMQIFSNAGQDEAEKIRDEATRLLGDEGGLMVPSKCSFSRAHYLMVFLRLHGLASSSTLSSIFLLSGGS